MADAIISVVLNRLAALMQEQIRSHVNLVRGVEKEVESLSEELNTVKNVLEDAEKKGCKDKSVKDWLTRLENTSYEMDDVLDEWNYSILKFQIEQSDDFVPPKKKVWSFIPTSCMCFKNVFIRHDIALKIKEVKARLDLILAEKDRYGFVISQPIDHSHESWRVQSTSLVDLEEICGRELETENLVSKLLVEGGSGKELGIHVVSVVGAGGLGKTTLAKLAYNDIRVKVCFGLKIWICVSDTFDQVGIANEIIEGTGGSKPKTDQLEMVLQCLKETISGKKFLLVLDDVWTEDDTKWEPLKNALKCGGAGSKILVTTRNERVAIMMGTVKNEIHYLGYLSHEKCWLVLCRIALSRKNKEECENFENIGKEIAKKCKGLPLAAKTLGSLLRFKNTLEEWTNILDSEVWELEKVKLDLFSHLLLSYNELSPALKRCFSYCAVFPKDTKINVESLITKWMAMGYLGSNENNVGDWKLRGREYFNKLAMCSLFQEFEKCPGHDYEHIKSFKMHDIIHDFAQFLRKNGGGLMKKISCQRCSPLLVSHVKEYRSLFHYKNFRNPHLCDCLTSVRLLSLRYCGLHFIPKEIEKLIHLRWLDLGSNEFPDEDLKSICKLYSLQFLWVDHCEVLEIPHEIGNLIHLKHLDLSWNKLQKELPESLCGLIELESLNVYSCGYLIGLPKGIHRLKNLKHLYNDVTRSVREIPQGLAQLTNLVTVSRLYCEGRDGSKLGWLKNLNRLSGSLKLRIEISSGDPEEEAVVVEDAREAELRKKMHIQELQISFCGSIREGRDQSVWMDIINALEPHPNLKNLCIWDYKGSRLPGWIESPLNQLRSIFLDGCEYISSLPALGKLPCLESFVMQSNCRLQFIGREFLGIETRGDQNVEASSTETVSINTIGFPKLQELAICDCSEWKEWEDITREIFFVAITLMPCLTKLAIRNCDGLTDRSCHIVSCGK
ncbi:hypothetical protein ABFS82_09G113900 [Erythranthe guttata]|uniref:putative disease resistance protein RGA3 n=1 Tax=Erythranthe guttata TaxID=4155 RepID=UPI00064DB72A|nr:PREDICTED: putative disease resistance protein RGA3 [Erythranthe guttata]|eukprot:XP_012856095.1 PREDICTED: putative disease resistance protein RGA3 [Erythranthe guttata]